ncbi:MAG: rhomboid family intramembrane serine protease [Gammaproteobacteria bacterium]|nr:rhomboid family intramembrane serine protease [Gammaproteobacteria bacterium]
MKHEDLIALGIFVIAIAFLVFLAVRSYVRNRRKRESGIVQETVNSIDVVESPLNLNGRFKHYPPVTTALIAISVTISILSRLGSSDAILAPLFIADPYSDGFQSVLSGQVWRLITPIFLHFGILHILFNMMWLWDLGPIIERKKGHLFLLGFVFIVGITSNIAQFAFTKSPFFGGMSGVVYGLLGYIWIHGRCNPQFGITLHKPVVIMMLAWFVLCWFGIFGPIANWAHTFGLGLGIALGSLRNEGKAPANL